MKALYAGSFDPITHGHMNIIVKSMNLFDEVHVGIGKNPNKSGLFTMDERLSILDQTLEDEIFRPIRHGRHVEEPCTLTTGIYEGSLARYAREIGATTLVRGLRQVSDFNDEFALHGALQKIAPDLNVVHLICDEKYLHVSSSTAREVYRLGEDFGDWLVPTASAIALRNKFRE